MSEPFIFVNTYAVKEGKVEGYKERCQPVVDLVTESEPRMIYFGIYFSDDGTEATTIQIHPDADSMMFHMQLAADHIRESAEYLDFTKMSVQILGTPNQAVMEQMRQLAGSGVPITVKSEGKNVSRLPAVPV